MPVGFGVSTETARSVVKNFKKQRKRWNVAEDTMIRLPDGTVTTKSNIKIDSKEQLLESSMNGAFVWSREQPNDALVIDLTSGEVSQEVLPHGFKYAYEDRTDHLEVRCGRYRLTVYKEHYNNIYNFTFSVLVGKSYVFDASNIKQHIIEQFNEDVYNEWKKKLRESTVHAKLCIELARIHTNKIIASAITCESSRRFCKRSGLFVSNDKAFLLPKKYKY